MADGIAAPVNALISITPLSTPPAGRDIGQVPVQLQNATPGTLVEGFVVNRDAQSNPILRTVLGDILVKSDVFIKTGSEVVFRVDTTQQGAARIISIDGQTPQEYASAIKSALPITADTVSATRLPTGATNITAMGLEQRAALPPLAAVLVGNTPLTAASIAANPFLAAATPIPAGLLKLQLGSQLQVKLLQVDLPKQLAATLTADGQAPITTGNRPVPAPNAAHPAPAPLAAAATQQRAVQQAETFTSARTAQVAVPPATAQPFGMKELPTSSAERPIPSPAHLSPQSLVASIKQEVTSRPLPPPLEQAVPEPLSKPAAQASGGIVTEVSPKAVHGNAPSQQPSASQLSNIVARTVTPASSAATAGIPAQVIGHEKDGATVMQTPVGTLKVQMAQPLPIGTTARVELTVVKDPINTPAPVGLTQDMEPLTTMAQHWSALDELFDTYAPQQDAAIARPMLQTLPEIGPKLTSGLLFFMAAVKGGDLKQWLGQRAVAALEEKSPQLAARLKQDMGQLQSMLVDSPLQHWNSAMVPMLYQGQLEHARFFFRHDAESETEGYVGKRGGKDQRFIVEVDLSHLGEMQFDGFVRPGEKAKQFDLMIRSSQRLPAELQEQIRQTFDTAMQTTGMTGYLAFQQGSQHFVRPLADTEPKNGNDGTQPILA